MTVSEFVKKQPRYAYQFGNSGYHGPCRLGCHDGKGFSFIDMENIPKSLADKEVSGIAFKNIREKSVYLQTIPAELDASNRRLTVREFLQALIDADYENHVYFYYTGGEVRAKNLTKAEAIKAFGGEKVEKATFHEYNMPIVVIKTKENAK